MLLPLLTGGDSARSATSDRRVHLLLLTDTSVESVGGSERFVRNLVSRLPSVRYRITVVQLTDQINEGRSDLPLFDLPNVTLHKLALEAVYGLRGWLALRTLYRLAMSEQVDIVQSQHEKSDLINALLPRGPGLVRISNRRDMGFNKSKRLRFVFRILNARFDCVVAPAQPILAGLAREERLDVGKQQWIPNGVDVEHFHPATAAVRLECRQALGLADDAMVFGCVASLAPVKRHRDLLEAFARARPGIPGARLVLVGDGPLRADIAAQSRSLGLEDVLILLGDRSDIDRLWPALDVAVLCSSTEGMSNALLEAMACGLPVIATSVGGNPQLVEDQVSGLLVPACEPAALADALLSLARAPANCRRMGLAARARIERDFSLDRMVQSFDQLYRRLLRLP